MNVVTDIELLGL